MAVADNTRMSDEAVLAATGRHPDDWFALLDSAGASGWQHPAIARWLQDQQDVTGWWAQGLTIRYEQARGLRVPGQRSDGSFAVSASKTVDGRLDTVYAAMVAAFSAEFGGGPTSSRADGARPVARWRPEGGGTVVVAAESAPGGRIRVSAQHEKLSSPALGDAAKARLQSALGRATPETGR
ncbi:MAG: hypothetical protein ABUT11_00930 [Leifsonia sp.]